MRGMLQGERWDTVSPTPHPLGATELESYPLCRYCPKLLMTACAVLLSAVSAYESTAVSSLPGSYTHITTSLQHRLDTAEDCQHSSAEWDLSLYYSLIQSLLTVYLKYNLLFGSRKGRNSTFSTSQ